MTYDVSLVNTEQKKKLHNKWICIYIYLSTLVQTVQKNKTYKTISSEIVVFHFLHWSKL